MAKVIDMSVGPHSLEGIKRITDLGVKIEEVIDQRTGKTYRETDISQLPPDGLFLIRDIRISNGNNIVKGSIKNFNKVHIGDNVKRNEITRKNIVEGNVEDVGEFRLGDE